MNALKETLMNDIVRREVLWGINYRQLKQQQPLPPKQSPLILPVDKCRKKQNIAREYLKKACKRCKKHLKKHLKKRCEFEPISPRLMELAVPNKRLVLANWKLYEHLVPVEMILRYDQIIRTTDKKNLEPREARHFFKQIDKKRRKRIIRQKRRLERKAKRSQLMKNIKKLANSFVEQLKNKPVAILNSQQLVVSDHLLEVMERCNISKKPKRTTMKPYKKSVLEIADKVAEWIQAISSMVDIDPEILRKHLAMAAALESSSESSLISEVSTVAEVEEEEEDEEARRLRLEAEAAALAAAEMGEEGDLTAMGFLDAFLTGEEEMEFDDDILNRLIQILSSCPPEFLDTIIDNDNLPGVTYNDVLQKLKELRDKKALTVEKLFLEQAMIDWANRCDPTQVDAKILDKIHETAPLLQDLFATLRRRKEAELLEAEELAAAGLGETTVSGILTTIDLGEGPKSSEGFMTTEFEEMGNAEEGFTPTGTYIGEAEEFAGAEAAEEIAAAKLFEAEEAAELIEAEMAEMAEAEGEFAAEFETPAASVVSEEKIGSSEEEIYDKEKAELALRAAAPFGDRIIYGHKAPEVLEHSPDAICCLSLKVWAVWLLEIAKNAQNWSRWILETVKQVRHYASIVRGDVVLPDGKTQVLYKAEWRKFSKRNVEMVEAWKQYSGHVRELSNQIFKRFSGKEVKCCPKCLQDHLIRDVAVAHGTFVALAEAINCAGYWHRCLDDIVRETSRLNNLDETKFQEEESSEESGDSGDYIIEEIKDESDDEFYELEELESNPLCICKKEENK